MNKNILSSEIMERQIGTSAAPAKRLRYPTLCDYHCLEQTELHSRVRGWLHLAASLLTPEVWAIRSFYRHIWCFRVRRGWCYGMLCGASFLVPFWDFDRSAEIRTAAPRQKNNATSRKFIVNFVILSEMWSAGPIEARMDY